ncbi:conserved hypothetical protein [Paecilomyces variotii No. 5]|uniref:Uncharacterized protein n=1 Tax=Byssochlamys spectabilis (strain No. 5 / NBRC 109023) TaxID=1356009 RepID=V5FMT7_BYSSN|nr:conserved hypothetical protein [Paecilomyces variotii No. 5]
MGLLCRRAKRTEGNSSVPSPGALDYTKPTRNQNDETEVLLIEDEGESVHLQRVSRPALSSDDQDVASIIPLRRPSSVTQPTEDALNAKRLEQKQRRLENIPGRLRRRLSREPRCPGFSSNMPEMRKHRVRSRFISANADISKRPFALNNALGSGLVNENEYDSDAQCISTPKGSVQAVKLSSTKCSGKSTGSPHIGGKLIIREESEQLASTDEPRDVPRADNEDLQVGSTSDPFERVTYSPSVYDGEPSAKKPATDSSENEVNGRQRRGNIVSELSNDSYLEGPTCFPCPSSHEQRILVQCRSSSSLHAPAILHKDSMSLMRSRRLSMNRALHHSTQSNDSFCTGDDAFSTEITKIQIGRTPIYSRSRVHSPSSFYGDNPPASHFNKSTAHLRSLSEPDCVRLHEMNISKRLASSADYPTSSGDQLPLSYHRQQDRSMLYNSLKKESMRFRDASLPEAPRLGPTNKHGRDISSFYLSRTSSIPSNYEDPIDKTRLELPTPSYSRDIIVLSKRHGRAREPRRYSALPSDLFSPNGDSRTFPSAEVSSAVDYTAPQTIGTQSKFKEQFELDSPTGNTTAVGIQETSRSVSVGWMSGGRRTGFGYAFVPSEGTKDSNSPTPVGDDPIVSPGQLRLGSSTSKYLKSTDQDSVTFNVAFPVDGAAKRSSYNDNCSEPGEIRELSGRRSRQHSSLRAKTEHLWAKLPSHSRTERGGSATYSDGVIVRDFCSRPASDYITHKELGREERASSAGRSRAFLRKWTRLYRSKSIEARRYRAGLTAEAAKYRQPNFPELQIPRGEGVVPHKEQLGDCREEVRRYELWMKQKANRFLMIGSSDSASLQAPSTGLQQRAQTMAISEPEDMGKENLGQ